MDDKPSQKPVGRVGQASVLLAITVACGNFMTGLDQNVVITALPAIGRSLGEAPTTLSLTLTAYIAALIIALPLGGWASDQFGARRAYSLAVLVFTTASVLCGLADTFWQLVAARILQGFGGALMGTVGQVVILSSFPRHKTLKINVYTSLASQVAPMVGPVVGGVLATYVSWRWIFFINLPVGLLVAALAAALFPAHASERAQPFDIAGFMLTGVGTALLVFGMNGIADGTFSGWAVAGQLVAAVVLLAIAVRHSLRARHPMLDIRMLRIRTFRISLLTGGGPDTIGLTAVMFVLPLMLQVGFGMSAAQSGSLTFLAAAGSVSSRIFLPMLLRYFGFRRLLIVNTPIVTAIVAAFALIQPATPTWLIAGLIILFGVLRSWQWGATGNLAYADVPPESLARFSAMYYVLWQLAVALGIGAASALLALLAGNQPHLTTANFHASFVIVALVTLLSLIAYLRLRADDGQAISGHGAGGH
jgi:EmrB/QacA subfamily drug resistance transporter